MQIPEWLRETFVKKAAVSLIAGLAVSVFAAVVLLTVERPHLVDEGQLTPALAGTVLSVASGAGLPVATAVLLSLLAYDAIRWSVRFLVSRRHLLVLFVKLVAHVIGAAFSALGGALHAALTSRLARWLARQARAMSFSVGQVLVGGVVVFACVFLYTGALSIGSIAVGQSARLVIALLNEPPATSAMVLGFAGAAALMYLGVGLFVACCYLAYRTVLRSLARWAWHSIADGSRAHG